MKPSQNWENDLVVILDDLFPKLNQDDVTKPSKNNRTTALVMHAMTIILMRKVIQAAEERANEPTSTTTSSQDWNERFQDKKRDAISFHGNTLVLPVDWVEYFLFQEIERARAEGMNEATPDYKKDMQDAYEKGKQEEQKRIESLIVEEILIAQKEGEKTSRLTSLYNKIKKEPVQSKKEMSQEYIHILGS